MFVIFPKYAGKKLKATIYTQVGFEIQPTSGDQQAIFINHQDLSHAEKVASQVAKDNPGIEILLARVQAITTCTPGKPKTMKVTDMGEILPATSTL